MKTVKPIKKAKRFIYAAFDSEGNIVTMPCSNMSVEFSKVKAMKFALKYYDIDSFDDQKLCGKRVTFKLIEI